MRFYQFIFLLVIGLMLLPGASCPPPVPDMPIETPQKNLAVFSKALEERDYGTAYYCLSQNTRTRYKFFDFKMMMEMTIFGILIKSMMINWETASVDYYTDKDAVTGEPVRRAKVVLKHWKYPEYTRSFPFVYEPSEPDAKDHGWRVDFTLAGVLNMPQSDEDDLFPPGGKSEEIKDESGEGK